MKELKLYQCEICGTQYKSKTECDNCEKSHKKELKIIHMRFLPYKNSEDGFPTAIVMKDANSDIGYWYEKRGKA